LILLKVALAGLKPLDLEIKARSDREERRVLDKLLDKLLNLRAPFTPLDGLAALQSIKVRLRSST
jgi:hypothetical protein